nr:MAG TPA: hypothetical protein [Bacteriophage sp.]
MKLNLMRMIWRSFWIAGWSFVRKMDFRQTV